MFYLDANVFVNALASSDEKGEKARRLLRSLSPENKAVTSTLTWDEVFWAIKKLFGTQRAVAEGRKLLSAPNIYLVPVTAATISLAQGITEEAKLNPRDAIHAASALENDCKQIITDDQTFDKVKGIKRIRI